jgi:hypothetical protein
VASGAGYMTGGGNMAAYGALLMVTTVRPRHLPMVLWFAVIAALGVFVAIPIKRQLINKEGSRFRPARRRRRRSRRSTRRIRRGRRARAPRAERRRERNSRGHRSTRPVRGPAHLVP